MPHLKPAAPALIAAFYAVMPTATEAALPNYQPLGYLASLDIKKPGGLSQACRDPSLAVEELGFVYIRDESGLGAYKMPLEVFEANYNSETQTISFPTDTPRVLCPI